MVASLYHGIIKKPSERERDRDDRTQACTGKQTAIIIKQIRHQSPISKTLSREEFNSRPLKMPLSIVLDTTKLKLRGQTLV